MKKKTLHIISACSLVLGLSLLGVGIKMSLPDYLSRSDFRTLAKEVKTETDTKAETESETTDDADEDGPSESKSGNELDVSIDWARLFEESDEITSWVSVENTDIDFPVLHGSDNEYYLYHDLFGRESYASVFLDYRADPNGRNCIVYGHTHYSDTGFHQIAEADEQWRFDQIGKVHYVTPEQGDLTFTPIAALHVYPQFADVQEFEWQANDADVYAECMAILATHEANGEWNEAVLSGHGVTFDASEAIRVSGGVAGIDHWWVLTPAEKVLARERAELSAFRVWLHGLCAQSDARRSDYEDYVASANRCVVLACCSWPFDSHRTLLVCVR